MTWVWTTLKNGQGSADSGQILQIHETTKDNSLMPELRTTSVVKKWSIWTNMENILIGIEIVYGVYKSHFGRFWRQVILGLEIRFITSGVTGRPDDNF